eukprot:NODE_4060_length_869_cov_27.235366_g3713_i1.p1 GENE.NODE_4060_length_869_cov_27.235366_g3713_i1~~NODE_4060_length_869_cov_27.235366_g3713_i1.p1  ORF type:complete len:171 (+),score=33.43 NODE_4060_length_869_cov_27.235366_g3713_i1:157-669(+)
MSGGGRRHRAKHLVHQTHVYDLKDSEEIALVGQCLSSGMFEVHSTDDKTFIAKLPHKFDKVVWIKRGDYVAIEAVDDVSRNTPKMRAMITHRLDEEDLKHLRQSDRWPTHWDIKIPEKSVTVSVSEPPLDNSDEDSDVPIEGNPNRCRSTRQRQRPDSGDSEESDSEESD